LEAKVRDVPGQEARSKSMSHGAEKKAEPRKFGEGVAVCVSVTVCVRDSGRRKKGSDKSRKSSKKAAYDVLENPG
jgi:hypothetical protein